MWSESHGEKIGEERRLMKTLHNIKQGKIVVVDGIADEFLRKGATVLLIG